MLAKNKLAVFWLIVLLLIELSACGFQLRGSGTLRPEMQQIYIELEQLDSSFGQKLNQGLQARGSNIATTPENATGTLVVTKPVNSRRLLSVNSLAQARDYLLFSSVRISLKDAQGKSVLANQKVDIRRELVADPNNILGSDQEAERLFTEMEDDLIQAILMRLRQY